jgi:putative endonuclease
MEMMFWFYILYSQKINRYYCGQTDNIALRLIRHNGNMVQSAKNKGPWILKYKFSCDSRSAALILEKKIKSRGIKRYLQDLDLV